MAKLFVDTSGFHAVADTSDRHHAAAAAIFVDRGGRGDLVTSDHVFVESWWLIRARLGRPAAIRYWDVMMSGVVQVHGVGAGDVVAARKIVDTWADQDFSLVDCTSFALMERLGIEDVLVFDRHFRIYRFGPQRKRAFRVIP